jgi:hypothetical protein
VSLIYFDKYIQILISDQPVRKNPIGELINGMQGFTVVIVPILALHLLLSPAKLGSQLQHEKSRALK